MLWRLVPLSVVRRLQFLSINCGQRVRAAVDSGEFSSCFE